MGATALVPDLLEDVRALLDDIRRCVDTILAAVQTFGSLLRELGATFVEEAAARLRSLADQVLAEIGQFVAAGGEPELLRAAGREWAAGVGGTAAALAGRTTLDQLQTDDHWHGRAGEAYRSSLRPQKEALTAVKTLGDGIDDALQKLATGCETFVATVVGAAAVADVALIGAGVAAATGVGLPAAVVAAVAALAVFLGGFYLARTTLDGQLDEAGAALDRLRSNDVAFPGGAWPRSTSPLDDASFTDGDPSDWSLQR